MKTCTSHAKLIFNLPIFNQKLMKISNHRCKFQQNFTLIINVSVHLPEKSYKIPKIYSKRREKVYTFP